MICIEMPISKKIFNIQNKIDPFKIDPFKIDPFKIDPFKIDPFKIDPFKLANILSDIDKNFCKTVEDFIYKNINYTNMKKFGQDEIVTSEGKLKISNDGRNIIRNFILERSDFLLRSNVLHIPRFKNENEINKWFEKNCNDLCLGISLHRNRHSKFHIKGSGSYSGIDYICRFIGKTFDEYEYRHCKDRGYRPFLNRYMTKNQTKLFDLFYDLVEADFMLIEIEYLSSNFVRHRHPSTIDMVICYKKDKDLSVPVLELGIGCGTND